LEHRSKVLCRGWLHALLLTVTWQANASCFSVVSDVARAKWFHTHNPFVTKVSGAFNSLSVLATNTALKCSHHLSNICSHMTVSHFMSTSCFHFLQHVIYSISFSTVFSIIIYWFFILVPSIIATDNIWRMFLFLFGQSQILQKITDCCTLFRTLDVVCKGVWGEDYEVRCSYVPLCLCCVLSMKSLFSTSCPVLALWIDITW